MITRNPYTQLIRGINLLLIIFGLLFATVVTSHCQVTSVSERVYTVPKEKRQALGIIYPYQVCYIWRYSYYDYERQKFAKGYTFKVGEDNNSLYLPHKILDITCEVSSFRRTDDKITGLIYREYHWYPQNFNNTIEQDTIKN